ncbi:MAG: hypothetical protein K9M94_04475 [Spirochaetia bacterium]|nr:hypothetical protein [Spirochaetia bacterium]
MYLTKALHRQQNKQIRKKKAPRTLLFGTIGSLLLLAGACSFTTEMADGSVNPKLSVMGLQSDVTEVSIRITGQDYQQSVTVTPSDSRVEFLLPPGEDVKFEMEATNQDSATSHVYSWGMTRYADLVEGKETELAFTMGPKDTKILVPDFQNSRLVQIDDMGITETNPVSPSFKATSDLGLATPYDIEIDNQGKIWIAQSSNSLVRIDFVGDWDNNLNGSDITALNITALAFDHLNSDLYYIIDNKTIGLIHVMPEVADINIQQTFDLGLESKISVELGIAGFGLAVDKDGVLYLAGANQVGETTIFKYDPQRPTGERVIATYTSQSNLPTIYNLGYMDLLVKNNHLYLTNPNGSSGNVIMKFTRDLQYVGSFGRVVDLSSETADQPGEFYGPTRFIATTADNIYLTDDADDNAYGSPNRIIRFKDINGANWQTYQPVDLNGDLLELYFPPAT